ncbi:MAG: DUF3221 domain-containing protein [Eubacteriaceae bacterium]|nr:DUF3221 domain-containing protein [Eubacteriaceae bacterium]
MKKGALLLLFFVIASLTILSWEKPINEANILKGTVLDVSDGSFLMVTAKADSDRYFVTVDKNTKFSNGVSKDFLVGNKVEIEHDGKILESYPMQVTAIRILWNDPAK